MRLLIVDDDADAREYLRRVLSLRGYVVEVAQGGQEALELAERTPPDMIIADTLMPGMDGFALCYAVKSDAVLREIPLVFFSANYLETEHEQLARSLGASGFISKASSRDELLSAIDALIVKHQNKELEVPVSPTVDEGTMARVHAEVVTRKLGEKVQELKREQDALRHSEQRFRDFAEAAADWFWETDSNLRFTHITGRYWDVTGMDSAKVIGLTAEELYAGQIDDPRKWERLFAGQRARRPFDDFEHLWTRDDGTTRVLSLNGRPIYGESGDFMGYRGTGRDVTETRLLSDKLSHQASHDALTGLVNRLEFERRLKGLLEVVKAEQTEHALCYLDLDQFKVINDTCGHVAGDELLRQLGEELRGQIRRSDTLARLGGDEFGVLIADCSVTQAKRVANAMRDAIERFRFRWEDQTFSLGVSMGLVPITEASGNLTETLSAADSACYAAKDRGRNRIHLYHENDAELMKRHGEMQWVAPINHALDEDRFTLHFQPIAPVDADNPEGRHFELLVRMRDGSGKEVPPGAFLPAAERYNLSVKIDRWVVRKALDWLTLRPSHLPDLSLCAINLSGHSLADEEFLDFVVREFERTDVPPQKICFEVTETAAIANLASATRFIKTLKHLGCRFALDDFGSGLSSFAYLKNLPVDFLKIDGVFVKDIVDDPIDLAMVKSINEIGHVMGKKTIAEFVENDEIMAILRDIGVDYAQGYGIAAPRPLEEYCAGEREDSASCLGEKGEHPGVTVEPIMADLAVGEETN